MTEFILQFIDSFIPSTKGMLNYLIICPIIGYILTLCLFGIVGTMGISIQSPNELTLKQKAKVWYYVTLLIIVLAKLFQAFV